MGTTIKDIVSELFLDKDNQTGIYKRMNMIINDDEQLSNLVCDFAEDFDGLIDLKGMLLEISKEKKLLTKEEKEGLHLEVTTYALALFLLYLEKNGMIAIYSEEKRVAKDFFMTFEKACDKKDYTKKQNKLKI